MGRITSFSKQVIIFFLVSALIIRPSFASTVGGWSLGGGVAQGASTVYTGTKQIIIDGKDYIKKGTAIVTPTATGVAKVLARGAAGYALSVAVEQLLGAVDWVLDPANNQIVYTKPTECNLNGCGTSPIYIYSVPGLDGQFFATQESACAAYNIHDGNAWYGPVFAEGNRCRSAELNPVVTLSRYNNPAYDPNAEEEEQQKTLPLETVAQKVISNAQSGDTNAQVATGAAAADIIAEAEKDNVKARPIVQQLESTSTTKPSDQAVADKAAEAQGTAKPNEANPQATDLSLEFPAFCGWAPTVCEFAQTAIQSIADAKAEYADKPQENNDTELEIPDPEEQSIDSDISFGGSCPAPLTSQVNFMGINETIEFSFENVCEIAEFIKPVVISVSAFSAALIVAGIRTEDD